MSEAEETQGTTGRLLAGRYRLGEVLGRGGMGTVWRARDETLGRTVAVKELRFPSSIDEDEKRRLITRTLREAKAIARIRSNGAVTVYDVVDEDDRPWIVMELIEGRSLADAIREDGPLPWRRAAEAGLAILDVLRAAHREGILHRDVKPSNVLIADDGRVVLTDFGIAQVEGDPSVTSTGMLVGAPSYISPERARGHKPGPPADLWSLGGLLYAAVEGVPPYDKGSAIATLTAVMTEPMEPPKHAGALEEVIYGLLAKDPEKRLDESGARALLTSAVNAPEDQGRKTPEPDVVEPTRAMALPPAPAPVPPVPSSPPLSLEKSGTGPRAADAAADRMRGALKSVRNAAASATEAAKSKASGTDGRNTSSSAPGGGSAPGTPPRASITDVVPKRTLLVVAAVVVLAVLATVLAVALSGDDDKGKGSSDSKDDKAASSGSAPAAAGGAKGEKGAGQPTGSASTDEADRKPARTADPGGLPEGYEPVKNGEYHFSIAMPKGWEQTATAGDHSGAIYSAAGGFPRLQVDFGSQPQSDAAQAWRSAQSGAENGGMKGYQGLGIETVGKWAGHDYPTVADWNFERDQSGKRVQVVNRGFKVDDSHGYAIMITCEKDKWKDAQCRELREAAFASFKPEG
ncbi:serine/threonine-protein kinase [Streptomyces sp. NPDC050617]|uniref:serine/threonine-protein kinase n=1 Tax=Streptomyces sp. NPDC050617 TaxID=3154628 RepID=UPI003445F41C